MTLPACDHLPDTRRIAVTGATSFISRHVVAELLKDRRLEVFALSTAPAGKALAALAPPAGAGRLHVIGDVSYGNSSDLRACLRHIRPDVMIHNAWNATTAATRNDLAQAANVEIARVLSSASSAAGCQRAICAGSQAEYGLSASVPFDERRPVTPISEYGLAKAESHRAWARYFSGTLCWLRLFAVYGPGDAATSFIPSVTRSILTSDHVDLTAGGQLADYVFVTDVATAMVAATSPDAAGAFDVGSGRSVPVRSVVRHVYRRVCDYSPGARSCDLRFGKVPVAPHTPMVMRTDSTRLQRATGWRPRTTLAHGLSDTVSWVCRSAGRLDARP